MTHAEMVAHLTGMHTIYPTAFGVLATHSLSWLETLHECLHQAGDVHDGEENNGE